MELVLKELNIQNTTSRDEPKDKVTPSPEFHSDSARPPITSLFENNIWFRVEGQLSAQLESDRSSTQFSNDLQNHQHSGYGSEQNRQVCEALLVALPPYAKVQEAADKHGHIWEFFLKPQLPESQQNLTLPEFAQQAVEKANAVEIAKVLQLVATVMDVQSYERLLLLVDRLIIWDDVYMDTLDGMECALSQGTLFANIGQARRSWYRDFDALYMANPTQACTPARYEVYTSSEPPQGAQKRTRRCSMVGDVLKQPLLQPCLGK